MHLLQHRQHDDDDDDDDDESEVSYVMQMKPRHCSKGMEMTFGVFECKILGRIYGQLQENTQRRICSNTDIYCLLKDMDGVTY